MWRGLSIKSPSKKEEHSDEMRKISRTSMKWIAALHPPVFIHALPLPSPASLLRGKGRPPCLSMACREGRIPSGVRNKRGRRVRSVLKESDVVNVEIRVDLHRKNTRRPTISRRMCAQSEQRRADGGGRRCRGGGARVKRSFPSRFCRARRETYLHYRSFEKRRLRARSGEE